MIIMIIITKKRLKMKVAVIPIVIGALCKATKGSVNGQEDSERVKSLGDLRRLPITQILLEDNQLILM